MFPSGHFGVRRLDRLVSILTFGLALAGLAAAGTLEVGPGKPFAKIEEAVARARPGDTVLVYPQAGNRPYKRVALKIAAPRLTIRGVPEQEGGRICMDGAGYDYSGAGKVPRAIVQFDPGSDGSILEGFELCNARNGSYNGAGVRINQANDITVRHCDIHSNDMGIMSNGSAAGKSGSAQRIEFCRIHDNGTEKNPGYNHNLYLGGTSAVVHGCEIFGSRTGHNLKSRCHFTWVEYCFIHASANRELDLVDEKGNTDILASHAVLLGNIIVKKANMSGNKAVIHFGQDGKNDHLGTVYLVHNTIVTPYASPVVDLSARGARAQFVNNLIWDGGAGGAHRLVNARDGASLQGVTGQTNWLAFGFDLPGGLSASQSWIGKKDETPVFVDPLRGDWRLRTSSAAPVLGAGTPWEKVDLPPRPGDPEIGVALKLLQYRASLQTEPRTDGKTPDLGACQSAH